MNVIEFKLCEEDRARLDRIIAGLEKCGTPVFAELQETVEHPADASVAHLEPVVAAPAAPVAEPAPADPVPEVKPISLGEFQKAIVTRCTESAEMKAKVQTLVHNYAPSVSEIPEGKRAEVLAALAKL